MASFAPSAPVPRTTFRPPLPSTCPSHRLFPSTSVLTSVQAPHRRNTAAPPSCPRPRPRRSLKSAHALTSRPVRRRSSSPPTTAAAAASPDPLVHATYKLASASGALGRGVRACLRAFYRRASFIVSTAREPRVAATRAPLYVEIGPAYVLATARMAMDGEHVTRYAVEQRAWPALRQLLGWEETSAAEARGRGAGLRRLREGGRYGRHLFLSYEALACVMQVAEDLLEVVEGEGEGSGELYQSLMDAGGRAETGAWVGMEVEGVVELRRKPLAGVRTVAARCPRGASHSNGDRKPSLMLWMNSDGITGGAMCPVCLDYGSGRDGAGEGGRVLRNMTWRVHYLPDNSAVLCTPQRRIRSPANVQEAIAEYRRMNGETPARALVRGSDALQQCAKGNKGNGVASGQGSVDEQPVQRAAVSHGSLGATEATAPKGAVGGCVMTDKVRMAQVGEVIAMAYVTASLRMATNANTTGEVPLDGARLRTVGTMARQRCPMQVLLWSDRRSKGPTLARRVEEVAWFARQAVGLDDGMPDIEARGHSKALQESEVLESEEWLPTPLVSVSAMMPSGWRDLTASNGRSISVPASWEPSVQAWVLFDIDDIERLEEGVVTRSGSKIALAVRRDQELSGRCLVMQTGPTGLHVWAEMREPREEPCTWFRKEEVRAWYSDLGNRLLQASHRAGSRGGRIDMSSCSAGRFARRPGWRLLEDGTLFRSRVVMYVPSSVRKRVPRI